MHMPAQIQLKPVETVKIEPESDVPQCSNAQETRAPRSPAAARSSAASRTAIAPAACWTAESGATPATSPRATINDTGEQDALGTDGRWASE